MRPLLHLVTSYGARHGRNPIALKLTMTSYLASLAVFIPINGGSFWRAYCVSDRHRSVYVRLYLVRHIPYVG